jgi:hypothetical protein
MALSANSTTFLPVEVIPCRPWSQVILSAAVVYNGSLCSHDTTTGEIKPFDGTQTDRLVGWHFGDAKTGNASGERVRATITRGGFAVRNFTCGGLANSAADYGAPVYATDDGTYTITDPGSGQKIGVVLSDSDRASGKATIYFLPIGLGV